MRRMWWLISGVGIAAIGLFAVGRLLGGGDRLPEIPDGDQELAWIHAATSGATWERFVAGVLRVQHDRPSVQIDDSRAFLDQTTAVPEVVIGLEGAAGRLHIRWYKLTSETDNAYWVRRLAKRGRPPLAFIGGGTSERAYDLAQALAAQKEWAGQPPLLLITTATANTIYSESAEERGPVGSAPTMLMDVYRDRSFRFCFTNRQMAQAVVDFLWSQPDLRPIGNPFPALGAIGEPALNPWGAVGLLGVHDTECLPAATALEWDDDPYSIDLSRQFHEAFHQPDLPRMLVKDTRSIPCSVGGYYRPNAWEAQAAEYLLEGLRDAPLQRQALIMPASAGPARRVLRAVTGVRPLAGRSLVAVTGDSININNVYRDTDIVWSSRALPIPLVFFAHQNPVAWDTPRVPQLDAPVSVAASDGLLPPNGTDDVLLFRDLVDILVTNAYGGDDAAKTQLVDSSAVLAKRFRSLEPPFFDSSGDRRGGRGEYVVALRPQFAEGAPVLSEAKLQIWTRRDAVATARWQLIQTLVIDHARRAAY
jgi:hypothetical protein